MSRSLVAHSLRFNRKRHPDVAIAPSDLDGINLLDYMEQLFDRCTFGETRDEYHQTMIECRNFRRLNRESCLMELSVAKWGEESQVLNPDDYQDIKYNIRREDPVAIGTRAYCFVPLQGEVAFFFSEYSDRSSGGQAFLARMRKDFVHAVPKVTFNPCRVFGAEEWLNSASIAEMNITVKQKASDRADRTTSYSGTLTYTVKPDKRTMWGRQKLSKFIGRTEEERRVSLVEIADSLGFDLSRFDDDLIDGKLTLEGTDKKRATFSMADDPRAPYMQIPINNSDGTEFDDEQFVAKCRELVTEYNRII